MLGLNRCPIHLGIYEVLSKGCAWDPLDPESSQLASFCSSSLDGKTLSWYHNQCQSFWAWRALFSHSVSVLNAILSLNSIQALELCIEMNKNNIILSPTESTEGKTDISY
jgi:hypothetical protein